MAQKKAAKPAKTGGNNRATRVTGTITGAINVATTT